MSAPNHGGFLHAFDGGDWSYYVEGHDPAELWVIDDPATLVYEPLWMRPIPAKYAEDYGVLGDDEETVVRDPVTGRFASRIVWVECQAASSGAERWLGCRYDTTGDSGALQESKPVRFRSQVKDSST